MTQDYYPDPVSFAAFGTDSKKQVKLLGRDKFELILHEKGFEEELVIGMYLMHPTLAINVFLSQINVRNISYQLLSTLFYNENCYLPVFHKVPDAA